MVAAAPVPRSARLVVVVACLVSALFSGLIALSLWQARQDAWAQASRAADNLLLLVNRDIQRHLDVFGVTLKGLRHFMEMENVFTDRDRLHRVLAIAAEGTLDVSSIYVLDPQGQILAQSNHDTASPAVFGDREYFIVHRDRPDAGLFVSLPYRSRLDHGVPSLVMSARLSDKSGAFAGVVAIAVRLSYLSDLFQSLDKNASDVVSLIHRDGVMMVRVPSLRNDGDMGADVSGAPTFREMSRAERGVFIGKSLLDGVPRYYHFEHIPDFPLIVTVGLGISDLFADWRRRAIVAGGSTALLCLALITASLLLRREIIARAKVDAELKRLSDTDGLTGIANRRRFDEHLDAEWRRAQRSGMPLSLLMIDADKFKLLNDRFGHARGDEVLKIIARTAADSLHRPADLAARYGGEEFSTILPDTDLPAALALAETIRAAIEVLAREQEAMTTVSLGVATLRPGAGQAPVELITAADGALYRAKEEGRNRVCAAG
ncbi:deoxyribonuclease [Azorhizobium oxalatiphilum]|uniref:diguanylate cyclase n=1 Tax=Azorhizobium oxalatiphilum TaxID=980631 RepID=A0A917BM19_9HYPH|nr:sensor domain-containing diguanylate cyclase [Azorhizobium oxalatiphilum]GGF49896.1 deoxyribonuclease [Azorhizobium oxalatiphilum]